ALLPASHADASLQAAIDRNRDDFSRQLLVLVRGPAEAATGEAARAARAVLVKTGLHTAVRDAGLQQALDLYRQHAFALLTPQAAHRLQQQGGKALATDVAVALASPAGLA